MIHSDTLVFPALFKECYKKCFGHALASPLTEAESKLFGNEIVDQTGLVIGWKSIKNYSFYVLNESSAKAENPSLATLDTLARYVLNAPYTNEIQRKNKESHYPYWFQYKEQFSKNVPPTIFKQKAPNKWLLVVSIVVFFLVLFFLFNPFALKKASQFNDDFDNVEETTLSKNGWWVQAKNHLYWNRKAEQAGALTLFTLHGDNWRDSVNAPRIQNLLLRKLEGDCFITEVHLKNFVPHENWQQAGILLLEDTNFIGKSVRLSLAYNDFAGGFPASRDILVQAITSLGNNDRKPEEIVHKLLFNLEEGAEKLVVQNLQHTALRIEKQGNRLRLLYSNGSMENAAFKELIRQEFDIKVHYIALFALKSFVADAKEIPVQFDFFSLQVDPCRE